MSEWKAELAKRLVIGHKRDGRCVHDEQAKRELVLACREPRRVGIQAGARLWRRLLNGVIVDLCAGDIQQARD